MLAKTEELIESYFAEADESLHMQHAILPLKDKYIILMNALQLELDIIRESVLNLFTFIYNTEHIEEVRLAFHINESHTLANAFELLEMNVSKIMYATFHYSLKRKICSIAGVVLSYLTTL